MTDVKVTSCDKLKEVDGKNGKATVYKVGLSDGRFGESFANQIPVNTPAADLQIDETQYGLKFKLIKKNGYNAAAKKPNNAAFALAYSKDWCIAQLEHGEKVTSKEIIAVAEVFYNWIESKG